MKFTPINLLPKLIITIDGPAGAGKTTVSKKLAEVLDYQYIDTGALYRAVALAAQKKGSASLASLASNDDQALAKLCRNLQLEFKSSLKGLVLFCDGIDITDKIRTPEISMLASTISARPAVRKALFGLQRKMGKKKQAVFEGRDMGTVIFPDADLKFFLEASSGVRALRRFKELGDTCSQTLKEVEEDILQRDNQDSTRGAAPLKPAKDAIKIDSTDLSADQVVEKMLFFIKKAIINEN